MWLLLDCNFLCHRAYHAFRSLSHDGIATGVMYGFFRDVVQLKDRFDTESVAFCFDLGPSKRIEIDGGYKASRRSKEYTLDELQDRNTLRRQIRDLRKVLLGRIGFNNVFSALGFEADDIIASLVETLDAPCVVVTCDSDLWQLISPRVSVWNPNKKELLDRELFVSRYGIEPTQWRDVKAIAGCSSDEVEGIANIGEKTAAKFLRGALNPGSKAHRKIVMGHAVWQHNLQLVSLPLPGTPEFETVPDAVSVSKWREMCDALGMVSLRDTPPISKRSVRTRRKDAES